MRDFWNQIVLDNPIRLYVGIAIAIGLAILVKRMISRFAAGLLYRITVRLGSGIEKTEFIHLLVPPLETFLVAFIIVASLEKLRFPADLDFEIYGVTSKELVHGVAKTILIGAFIWLLLRAIDFIAQLLKQKARAAGDIKDHQLVVFFRDFLKAFVAIIGLLMVLGMVFNFEVSKLWTGLGLAGAALALATKESIENLIASFIIFFDKPFTTGDSVKVNGISGAVEKIGLRSTRVRTDQKTYVTIPNKQMVDSVVDNLTLRTQRKAEIRLQVGLSASAATLQDFVAAVRRQLDLDAIESPSVFLSEITGSAFQVNVDYFTQPIPQDQFNALKQQVNLAIVKTIESMGMSISGSSVDVNLITSPSSPAGTP